MEQKKNGYVRFLEEFNRDAKCFPDWFSGVELFGLKHYPYVGTGDDLRLGWAHSHSFYELHMVNHGAESYIVNGKEICVSDGEYLLIFRGVGHYRTAYSSQDDKYVVNFGLPDDVFLNLTHADERRQGLGYFNGKTEEGVLTILRYLFDQAPLHDQNGTGLLSAGLYLLFESLFADLLRENPDNTPRDVSTTQKNISNNSAFCEQIKTYIDEHIGEPLTLPEVSRHFHISIRQLNRRLVNYYGFPFSVLVDKIRGAKAVELLRFSDKSVQEIAEELGYLNTSSFIRFFRKIEGCSPGHYRYTYFEGDIGNI